MWYVVQTPVGREAKRRRKTGIIFYRDKAEKALFCVVKRTDLADGRCLLCDTEVMFQAMCLWTRRMSLFWKTE